MPGGDKIPVSTLVVIHTPKLEVLLLERADRPGFWQSVTGSQHPGEALRDTAIREVAEETGIDARGYLLEAWDLQNVYEIYPLWRHRYPEGITHKDRKSTRLNSSHIQKSRMPSSA